jgi:plastocyanin
MRQASIRPAVLLAAVLALAVVAGACSGDDGDGDPVPTDTGGGEIAPGSAAMSIADLAFEPTTLTVASGSTDIEITNADSVDHTFTLDDDSVDQAIAAGESATVTVDIAESIGFHCEIHPSMTGTLQVA